MRRKAVVGVPVALALFAAFMVSVLAWAVVGAKASADFHGAAPRLATLQSSGTPAALASVGTFTTTATRTPTTDPTATATPTHQGVCTLTPTITRTFTNTPTPTPTITLTPTGTLPTFTSTPTITPIPTHTLTGTITPSHPPTNTGTITPTFTYTSTNTATATAAPCIQPATEGFESGTLGMFDSSGSPGWTAATDNPHSGSYSAHAPDVGYVSDQILTLNAAIALPPNAQLPLLSFWHRYDFDLTGSDAWDGGVLEMSVNGGSWGDVPQSSGRYNGILVACPSQNPLAGRQAWVGSSNGWVQTTADLTGYIGQSVRFRFRVGTGETVGAGGWWIDDFVVNFSRGDCATPTATGTVTDTPTITPTPMPGSPTHAITCTFTPTFTVTPTYTRTRTYTVTPTGTVCQVYQFATTTGTIVPGTLDTGNHTDDGVTEITLPFAFTFYTIGYNTANVSSNGNLQFQGANTAYTNNCLPDQTMGPAIFPYWDDLRTDGTNCPGGCGIFTSVSGSAPNRIFNIEWRAVEWNDTNQLANFEIRLYEVSSSPYFEIVLGQLDAGGASATIGAQGKQFNQFECNYQAPANTRILFYPASCGPPTFTPTPPTPPTQTYTRTSTPTPGPCVLPITEGFESGTLGIFQSNGSPGWTPVTANPHSGSYSAHAPDVGYVSDQQLTLSNAIAVPLNATQATLSFWQRYDFESEGSTAWDGGVLELSANGGSWNSPAFQSGGYNGLLVACPSLNPLAGRSAWTGSSGGWVQSVVDLMPYRGQSVRFRFREGTDDTRDAGGWWVDDVSVAFTQSFCWTPTATLTPTPGSPTHPPTCTLTPTYTPSYTLTPTLSPTITLTPTGTPPTATDTPTITATWTARPPTLTRTLTPTYTHTPTPGPCTTPITEDFESSSLGLFYSVGTPGWSAVIGNPHSGLYSAHAPDVGFASEQVLILSAEISVPWNADQATLSFWQRYDFDIVGTTAWDGGVLELYRYSAWEDPVFLSGGYNGSLVFCPSQNPLAGRAAWVGSSGGWVQTVVDLTRYRGHGIVVRFRLGTDEARDAGGWWIDDLAFNVAEHNCQTPTDTSTPTVTSTITPTISPSATVTGTPPTHTTTPTPGSPTHAPTCTLSPTQTHTFTLTPTLTPTGTPPTFTSTPIPTNTVPATVTVTFTACICHTSTPTFTLTPGPCVQPITEGFERGTLGIFQSSGSPGWIATTGNPHSGSYSAFAPDVGYVSDQQLTLINPITIPANATQAAFTFWQRYDFDSVGSTAWDGGVLEISVNDGAWDPAPIASGGFNGVLVTCPSLNPLAGREAWVGSSGGWVQAAVDLMPYSGQMMRFRFRLGTDDLRNAGGWWIDDIAVTFTQSYCWTPTATATLCPLTFTDVHPTDYFYAAVQYLYCRGVVSGYSDGTFRPFNYTTRGQLTKIIVLAEGWQLVCPDTGHFSDVPPGSAFYCYVETAFSHGIISGYANGTFHPENDVTRGQLCKIVVLAEGWGVDCPQAGHFSDVPPGYVFYCEIETAFNHGLITGYADGTFRPGGSATRGQICKIVYLAVAQN